MSQVSKRICIAVNIFQEKSIIGIEKYRQALFYVKKHFNLKTCKHPQFSKSCAFQDSLLNFCTGSIFLEGGQIIFFRFSLLLCFVSSYISFTVLLRCEYNKLSSTKMQLFSFTCTNSFLSFLNTLAADLSSAFQLCEAFEKEKLYQMLGFVVVCLFVSPALQLMNFSRQICFLRVQFSPQACFCKMSEQI